MEGGMIRGVSRPEMNHNKSKAEMLIDHHQKTLWVYWTLIILGFWLISTPVTFNYSIGVVSPSGARELWLTLDERIQYMRWSDSISGLLLILLGFRALRANRPVSLWMACFIGVWLSFAPILFWAPTALSYYNDTLIGLLIMALTVLIPGMPNMINYMEMGPSLPPGWSYNPSSWPQRWIMIVLGLFGWLVSRYLAAYQLGYINTVWDPFFGDSTYRVLDSQMSHSLPISDAGLGSLAYTFEFLMGFMGSPSRWRTMPWMVTFFGILVIPLGLVHIFLVISQPVIVGYWCTFCLLAAAIMLPMLPLEVDEVIAMIQFMKRKIRDGESFWKIFWKGGGEKNEKTRDNSPELYEFNKEPSIIIKASLWGMTFPWTLVTSTLIGLFITFLPVYFNTVNSLQNFFHVSGLLIITFSVLAMGEPFRSLRLINILLAFLVTGSAVFLEATITFILISFLFSFSLVILSIPRGPITQHFGEWNRYIK